MKLATSKMISDIDKYAEESLAIPMYELMNRSGEAVMRAVEELLPGGRVMILAGSGNNGADGYAAAKLLFPKYSVAVIDVFGKGQRSEAGARHLAEAEALGVEMHCGTEQLPELLADADVIVDAILGTGVKLPLSETAAEIAKIIEASSAKKIAVDVPLGIDPDTGEAQACAPHYDITVELSLCKAGVLSYPAREYAGRMICSDIGLGRSGAFDKFAFRYFAFCDDMVREVLPERRPDSNKGSFGRCALIVGSEKYKGAAILALEAALRSGVGYTEFYAENSLSEQLVVALPEAIYKPRKPLDMLTNIDISAIIDSTSAAKCILLGSGCGVSEGLLSLAEKLLEKEGAPLVLDADAINALAKDRKRSLKAIKRAKRTVILTPHPLELSRLSGVPLADIQSSRLATAMAFAEEHGCVLILKGAATVATDGERAFINTSGSSALAKAGSGDALAGFITGLVASSPSEPLELCALGVYIHGKAADSLASEYSEYGVTPSDLPKQMAREIKNILNR